MCWSTIPFCYLMSCLRLLHSFSPRPCVTCPEDLLHRILHSESWTNSGQDSRRILIGCQHCHSLKCRLNSGRTQPVLPMIGRAGMCPLTSWCVTVMLLQKAAWYLANILCTVLIWWCVFDECPLCVVATESCVVPETPQTGSGAASDRQWNHGQPIHRRGESTSWRGIFEVSCPQTPASCLCCGLCGLISKLFV